MQSVKTPPRTIMEVFKMLPEGTLAEIINGSIYMSLSPTTRHQIILRQLAFVIFDFVKHKKRGAEVFFSPYDVFLDEHSNAVQPDIVLVLAENKSIIKEDAIHGIPGMIIEILSPSNADHDLVRKKDLYEKSGIPEYWIVNPETKETVGFFLKDGKYRESEHYVGKIHSVILDNAEFEF
jgi:Uma2 family endonuclease